MIWLLEKEVGETPKRIIMTKARPLIFIPEHIPKLYDGTKTMTRRVGERYRNWEKDDLIWVKETWTPLWENPGKPPEDVDTNRKPDDAAYKADEMLPDNNWEIITKHKAWKSPCFMPRWASRITLELTADVRYEPLQEISNEDILKEGICSSFMVRQRWVALWDSIAKPGKKWADNPEVAVIEFRRVER